ncbi:hypothetical protein OAF27_02110 [Verrucomicrobiales bacterium]|nr:hypothetical protein [Verrucomicrobiales bacterium]
MSLTVALAEPRWHGHHPTYFREFVSSLLRNNCDVLALCSGYEDFKSQVEKDGTGDRVTVELLEDREKSFLFPGREHDPINTLDRWTRVRTALSRAERNSGKKADLVFFPFLDSMLRFQMLPGAGMSKILGRPWAGLYFRNHHFAHPDPKIMFLKGDHTMRASGCIAIGALDERYLSAMEEHAPTTPFIQWPDITDESPATESTPFSDEIKALAKGRPIIGLIGLERRKGVHTLLKAATEDPRLKKYFFAFTGSFFPDSYPPEELELAETVAADIKSGKIDNIYFKTEVCRIPDGVEFNTLFSTFDIIYAAYEDFCGSSNTLTKSSIFKRKLIATAGECVGRRVEKFGMGETIPEGDSKAAADAIVSLLENGDGAPEPRFDEYHTMHDRKQLDGAFAKILALVGETKESRSRAAVAEATTPA